MFKKLDLRLQADRDKLIHTTCEVVTAFMVGFVMGMFILWVI